MSLKEFLDEGFKNDAARKAFFSNRFAAKHQGKTLMKKGVKMILNNGVWARAKQ